MGHERLGLLPKTKRWSVIVEELAGSMVPQKKVESVARETIRNIQGRLFQVNEDSGVIAAFKFIVALSVSAQYSDSLDFLHSLGIVIGSNASPYFVAKAIHSFVSTHLGSPEYGNLAQSAAVDAISVWHNDNRNQLRLFDTGRDSLEVWRKTGGGAGFCELSRLFFAKFTERYINYFLERVLSSTAESISDREELNQRLSEHVEVMSKHAFETAKITQSFAAGWFNKYADRTVPSDEEIKRFLRIAFGKLTEELGRDAKT